MHPVLWIEVPVIPPTLPKLTDWRSHQLSSCLGHTDTLTVGPSSKCALFRLILLTKSPKGYVSMVHHKNVLFVLNLIICFFFVTSIAGNSAALHAQAFGYQINDLERLPNIDSRTPLPSRYCWCSLSLFRIHYKTILGRKFKPCQNWWPRESGGILTVKQKHGLQIWTSSIGKWDDVIWIMLHPVQIQR